MHRSSHCSFTAAGSQDLMQQLHQIMEHKSGRDVHIRGSCAIADKQITGFAGSILRLVRFLAPAVSTVKLVGALFQRLLLLELAGNFVILDTFLWYM